MRAWMLGVYLASIHHVAGASIDVTAFPGDFAPEELPITGQLLLPLAQSRGWLDGSLVVGMQTTALTHSPSRVARPLPQPKAKPENNAGGESTVDAKPDPLPLAFLGLGLITLALAWRYAAAQAKRQKANPPALAAGERSTPAKPDSGFNAVGTSTHFAQDNHLLTKGSAIIRR